MNWRKIIPALLAVVLLATAWRSYGWAGLALVGGGLVMWLLLHFNRIMHVMKRAADRPKGYVASAVMLNAKLKPGLNLLHVMALTHSLGESLSAAGEQPEIFRWSDAGDSRVTCEFANGRLQKWELSRPPEPPEAATAAAP